MKVSKLIKDISQRAGQLFARNDEEYVVVCVFPLARAHWQVWIELWDEDRKLKEHQDMLGYIIEYRTLKGALVRLKRRINRPRTAGAGAPPWRSNF